MQVTFLGTSGAIPTTERNPSGLLLEREGERFLFDCGEGTQRQMMRYGTGFDVDHICVTHKHGDHILGLPGLLQTWDFNDREQPVTIHAPSGIRPVIKTLVDLADNQLTYSVHIDPCKPGETIVEHEEYELQTFGVDHGTPAIGYILEEYQRKGRFDRKKAEEELGLPPGPKYSKLHEGEPVEHGGRTIQPEEVVGPPRPGRRFVYTGDTRPTESTVEAAQNADLLVHDGTFSEQHSERAMKTAHSTAKQAGQIAQKAGAKRLALTHLSTRYTGRAWQLEAEVQSVFDGRSFVADDGLSVSIPFPDVDAELSLDQLDR